MHRLPDSSSSRTPARAMPRPPTAPRPVLTRTWMQRRARPAAGQGRAGCAGLSRARRPTGDPPTLPQPPPHRPRHPLPAQRAGAAGHRRPPQRHAPSSCPRPLASRHRPRPARGRGRGRAGGAGRAGRRRGPRCWRPTRRRNQEEKRETPGWRGRAGRCRGGMTGHRPRRRSRHRGIWALGEEERDREIERGGSNSQQRGRDGDRNTEADLIKTKHRHGSCVGTDSHLCPLA